MTFQKNATKHFIYDKEKLGKTDPSWRLNRPKIDYKRVFTGIKDLDAVLGGFPYGITIFVGDAGTGKSMLAQHVANQMAKQGANVLYVFSESPIDVDTRNLDESVYVANFFQFRPKWVTAIEQILFFLDSLDIDFLVIDSLTTLFSETTKAVDEADIRGAISELKERLKNQIPVIGISQIRGQGMFTSPAGGKAVDHVADLLVYFSKVTGKSNAGIYEKSWGDYIWSLNVQKDKTGMARQSRKYEIIYNKDTIDLREVE